MGLGFLVPAFLVGLAAIAIPIIVHLLNKERKEVVRFPSLMFLERIPYRAVRRQTIRHPLLLALRALAILLLVAAFARPFFDRAEDLNAVGPGGIERVILLDRSYSMGYGTRWARALEAARKEAGLGEGGRATIVVFDEQAEVLGRTLPAGSSPAAALDSLRPGSRATRLGPALATAREIFAASSLPEKELVVISDLQRSSWEGGSEGRIPANVSTRIIPLVDSTTANAMIARVEIDPDARAGQVLGTVVAELRNQDSRRATRTALLDIAGREVESRPVEIPALGTATVRFAPVQVPPTATRGTVRLSPDALTSDDIFHFALSRDRSLPVLVLSRTPATRSIFLRRALALGDEPPFALTMQTPEAVNPATLGQYAVIVLNNIAFPGGALGARLAERVNDGAGLVVVAGEGNDPARWNQAGSSLLPVTAGRVVDRTNERGGRLGVVERSHRVFQLFTGPRSGDFSAARFLRYRTLETRDSAKALAWFDDGTAALVEGVAGNGRVLVWGSTLDDFWNDLVLQPVFLPFLHSLVRYAAGYTPDPAWRTVGQELSVRSDSTSSTRQETLLLPNGERQQLREGTIRIPLSVPGFFQVQSERQETMRLVAVNVDRKESDLTAWNPEELKAAITSTDTLALAGGPEVLTAVEREEKQRVWWFLLAGAALLLLVEVVLANRMSRSPVGARPERTMQAGR